MNEGWQGYSWLGWRERTKRYNGLFITGPSGFSTKIVDVLKQLSYGSPDHHAYVMRHLRQIEYNPNESAIARVNPFNRNVSFGSWHERYDPRWQEIASTLIHEARHVEIIRNPFLWIYAFLFIAEKSCRRKEKEFLRGIYGETMPSGYPINPHSTNLIF